MKCEDAKNELIALAGGRIDSAKRSELDKHVAGCTDCRKRLEEYRALSSLLDELPAVEPSFGFDARVRRRVAEEPAQGWFAKLVPQPRLALSGAVLVLLAVWVVKMQPLTLGTSVPMAQVAAQQEDFNAIQNLDVLENYDVLTKFDALSEASGTAPQTEPAQSNHGKTND
jgi:anti-sigma factor RsiW